MTRARWMLAAMGLALVPLAPGAAGQAPDPPRSPRNASYTLAASLDPATHTITGRGRLTWRNITSRATDELRFHLYWNAWRDTHSSWMRAQPFGRNASLLRRPASDFGGIDVTTLAVGGVNLQPRARFDWPDDGNSDDRTLLVVPLETEVAPGASIDVDLAWTATVPRTFARTGRLGSYYFIAQWFPKIAVLEDDGWNAHQFHANTEFFADFGVYDVSLTVPDGWVVGATGVRTDEPASEGGRATHRYVQADVHDFAWTTSPDFVERRERFDEPGLPPVEMRLLLQPEHVEQADRHFSATRAALEYYGTWFGPYPYPQITIVDPAPIVHASQGSSTGGMEYPTLFTAGTRLLAPWSGTQPESVTVHEAGHQFWYGIVATNEFEDAWMDEGLNTFSTARVLAEAYPGRFGTVERYFGGLLPWPYADAPWTRAIDGNRLNAYRPVASSDYQSTETWRYWPGTASQMSYNKTALWLATLERQLGWETTRRILATHFERGAFRHPTPAEFFAIANEVSGRDLTWFFDNVYNSSAAFDYGIAQVATAERDSTRVHTVVVRRYGEGMLPVTVRATFDDGTARSIVWEGRERWRAFDIERDAAIATVAIDPERVLLLDVNYTNNTWTARPKAPVAASRWAMRWLTWMQELLLTYAFLA